MFSAAGPVSMTNQRKCGCVIFSASRGVPEPEAQPDAQYRAGPNS